MNWYNLLSIIIGSGVFSSVVTYLLNRRKLKAESDGVENDVLVNEINFLSERQNLLNKQLTDAIQRELTNMQKIAELTETVSRLSQENKKLKNKQNQI